MDLWARSIVQFPLPDMKQGDGRAVGYFDQAFMMLGLVVISFTAGGAFLAFRMLRRR